MKEKNYALIFKKGAYETCSYIFDEVVIFEDDCIINKSKYNTKGKKIPKEIIHEINKEVVTKIITQNHSIDCSFKINEFNLEALKQYNYFALKIPNLVCSSFVYFFNSSFNKNSFDKAIPIYLYAIGQTINNMDRHDREFKIKTKNTNFMEFFFKKLGNEEVIRNIHKSMIIKNNHFSQNEEIRKSNNIPIQKTNKELGKVDISSINPDDVIEKYGADTLRFYEMFMGPLEASLPWSNTGLDGAKRFLDRVHRMYTDESFLSRISDTNDGKLDYIYNVTVKKIDHDFENLQFNTALSQMMVFVNECYKAEKIYRPYLLAFAQMLACVCPHLGQELYNLAGGEGLCDYVSWPTYDDSKTVLSEVEIAVQICGKMRGTFKVKNGASEQEIEALAFEQEFVKSRIEGKQIKKVIVIKNKIVNIVAI